jgi:hypothetical protein
LRRPRCVWTGTEAISARTVGRRVRAKGARPRLWPTPACSAVALALRPDFASTSSRSSCSADSDATGVCLGVVLTEALRRALDASDLEAAAAAASSDFDSAAGGFGAGRLVCAAGRRGRFVTLGCRPMRLAQRLDQVVREGLRVNSTIWPKMNDHRVPDQSGLPLCCRRAREPLPSASAQTPSRSSSVMSPWIILLASTGVEIQQGAPIVDRTYHDCGTRQRRDLFTRSVE